MFDFVCIWLTMRQLHDHRSRFMNSIIITRYREQRKRSKHFCCCLGHSGHVESDARLLLNVEMLCRGEWGEGPCSSFPHTSFLAANDANSSVYTLMFHEKP